MTLADLGGVWDAENTRQTEFLIEASGREISLMRPGQTDDGAGGTAAGEPVAQPVVRRYFAAVRGDDRLRNTIPGTDIVAEYVLIGMPGDDIRDEDYFILGTRRYDIRFVDDTTTYQVKALVMAHGN